MSLAVPVMFAIMVTACGGGGSTAAPSTAAASAGGPAASAGGPAASAGGPAAGASSVSIADFKFDPNGLTVKAGTEVVWTNDGDATHTVKWSDSTPESPKLTHGQTYSRKLDTAGSFPYVCGIHGSMTGTITVTQ